MDAITVSGPMPGPPDAAWRALVDERERRRWWPHASVLEPVPGGRFEEEWDGVRTRGTVERVEPPHRLELSWADEDWPAATRVAIELGDGRATVRHAGWAALPDGARRAAAHERGWARHLRAWGAQVRAAEDVRAFLRERHPEAAALALGVRAAVLDAEPDLIGKVYRGWDGIGFRHPDGGYVCAIYPQGDHVRLLFEHGIRLEDPHGRLEGAGTQTRFLAIRASGEEDLIADYVRSAVAERVLRP